MIFIYSLLGTGKVSDYNKLPKHTTPWSLWEKHMEILRNPVKRSRSRPQ